MSSADELRSSRLIREGSGGAFGRNAGSIRECFYLFTVYLRIIK
jgi:hypothetical protein